MTEAQIRAAFPDAVAVHQDFLARGVATLGLDSIRIGATDYQVFFAFNKDTKTLQSVHLRPVTQSGMTEEEFRRLESLLVQKYGRPWHRETGEVQQSQWTAGTTLVTLKYTNLRSVVFRTFWLTYEKRSKVDTDKL